MCIQSPIVQVLIRGGSCAVNPLGKVLLTPDFTKEGVKYVDLDLSIIPKVSIAFANDYSISRKRSYALNKLIDYFSGSIRPRSSRSLLSSWCFPVESQRGQEEYGSLREVIDNRFLCALISDSAHSTVYTV